MDISKLSSADFEKIIGLLKQKEKLQALLVELDGALARVAGGGGARPGRPAKAAKAAPAAKAPRKARRAKRGKRGALKEAVIAAIKAAGKPGITAKDIATQVNKPVMNVYTWFNTTGKAIKNIKKEGDPLRYRWEE
ncbi:MAG: hypothetical protein ACKO3N_03650 [Verrucomicrobiota bacterium]